MADEEDERRGRQERRPLLLHRPLLPSDRIHYVNEVAISSARTARTQTKRYLTSKVGHYNVIVLVSLDVVSIFAEFLVNLLACEGRIPNDGAETAEEVLGIVSLIFSCLFMLELLAGLWAFGGQYASKAFSLLSLVQNRNYLTS